MKHYFLFGGEVCRELMDGGIKAAIKCAKTQSDWAVFVFEDGITTPEELMEAADGWSNWACLTEKEYKKLNNI
jgi:hypothetical protein